MVLKDDCLADKRRKCGMTHPLKNLLNRMFWDKREDPRHYEVTFIHRGAPKNLKVINGSTITKVGKSWITYSSEDEGETVIPFHRIVEVRNVETGFVAWRSRRKSA